MATSNGSLKEKVARQSEDALGRLAQDLLQSPVVTGTITMVFETRERASRLQEVAMAVLNLPSATDLERLTRRLRSISQRIEGIEDNLDGVAERLDGLKGSTAAGGVDVDSRLTAIEAALTRIEQSLPASGDAPTPGADSDPGGYPA